MSVAIRFGNAGGMKEIIACADHCFDCTTPETSFEAIVSKFYHKVDTSNQHLLVRIDGKLVGLVGLCPETLQVNGKSLSMMGVGTVCTRPEARGKGVMQLMLNRCNDEFAKVNCDVAFLAGLYHRYHHFGYELGEQTKRYTLQRQPMQTAFHLHPLQENDGLLTDCLALHDTQSVRVLRTMDSLYGRLTQWQQAPYAILTADDTFVGYCCYQAGETLITELQLSDWSYLESVLQTVANQLNCETLTLELSPNQTKAVEMADKSLSEVAPEMHLMLQIRHFAKFIDTLLPVKSNLEDGCFVLAVKGRETVEITVQDGTAQACVSDKTPDLTLDWVDATKLLFGALPQEQVPEQLQSVVKSWFPLPFYLPCGDQF